MEFAEWERRGRRAHSLAVRLRHASWRKARRKPSIFVAWDELERWCSRESSIVNNVFKQVRFILKGLRDDRSLPRSLL